MRVALYVRVSTEEQAINGLSIDTQIATLDAWAEDHNHSIVDHYVDAGISARKPASKRPELQRLLKDIEAGRVDLVAFTKLDRWFRNIAWYYKVQEILEQHNVAWTATNEDYETQTASGRLKVNIMLSVGQDEADRDSERIKAVFDQKRLKGEALSGKVPFGVEIVDKKLVPTEDAPKVKAFFNYYLASESIGMAHRAAPEILGKRYSYATASKMLENKTYLDLGIIDQATWDAAQDLKKRNSPRKTTSGRVFLFQGMIRCDECGGVFMAHGNGDKYAYYCCRRANIERTCHNKGSISEIKIEKFLLRHLVEKCHEFNATLSAAQTKKPENKSAIKRKMDKLADLYLNDLISRDKYESEYKALQEALQRIEIVPKEIDVVSMENALNGYQRLSPNGKKLFWGKIIKCIRIGKDKEIFLDLFVTY